MRARDLMTPNPPVVTVAPDVDGSQVTRMMEGDQVRRVLVTEGGRMVGVIARRTSW